MNDWLWRYEGYLPASEGQRESLCTLGNGYMATRGAVPESSADDIHYPGTYLAGVFNRLSSEIAGRTVVNESIVNAPNWLPVRCRAAGGTWFTLDGCEVLEHTIEVDLHRSVHTRRSRLCDDEGRVLSITQRRLVSLRHPHLAALESTFVAENFSEPNWSGQSTEGSTTPGWPATTSSPTTISCTCTPGRCRPSRSCSRWRRTTPTFT